jgi:hypothetical protein
MGGGQAHACDMGHVIPAMGHPLGVVHLRYAGACTLGMHCMQGLGGMGYGRDMGAWRHIKNMHYS